MNVFKAVFCLVGLLVAPVHSHHSPNFPRPLDIFYEPPVEKASFSVQVQQPQNMSCGNLGIDQSCVIINSNVDYPIQFLYQSMECEKCSLLELKPLLPGHSQQIVLNLTSLGTVWQVNAENNKSLCRLTETYLGENSWYHIDVNQTGCSLVCDKKSEFPFPIFIAMAVYTLMFLLWWLGVQLYQSRFFNNLFHRSSLEDIAAAFSSSSTIEDKKQNSSKQRLRSLDTVRGIAIVVMIFVNYGGGRYSIFHHSRWNGLTVADLVFPWFIWMMGMSMAFSLKSQLRRVVSKKKIFFKIFKRSVMLFALGLMLNTLCLNVNLNDLRIPGVLQRFGISYLVVATMHLFYASADDEAHSGSPFSDIINYGGEWLIMIMFLTIHILLTFLVHSPDCPQGYLGPGGLHDQGDHVGCIGGAAGYVDRVILGSSHLYQRPSSKVIYHSKEPYDPEGILGFFTSIFLVFLGLQAGKIILMYKEPKARLFRWLIWGVLTGCIAGILCCFSKNDGWIPVNKNLWSVSFILATGSLAFILLSICYYVIDVVKIWSGAPFYYAGMNAILLYVGHEITHNMFPWSWEMPATHGNQLFMDLWGTSLWVVIAVWMHHKNTFVTV